MKKIDPDRVRQNFDAEVRSVYALRYLVEDVPGAARKLSELLLLAAVVQWESFLTDLFVAYVNRDATPFRKQLETRLAQSVKEKFGELVSKNVRLGLDVHLNRQEVISLIDHQGRNLSFRTADDLVEKAQKQLTKPHSDRITNALGPQQRALIDAWTTIRNYVAHRSWSAENEMNDLLAKKNLVQELRRGKNRVNSAGKYLSARVNGGKTRLDLIVESMQRLAAQL